MVDDLDISQVAKVLSDKGASKGGLARARRMTKAERSESARIAAVARWQKTGTKNTEDIIPWAIAEGEVKLEDQHVPCAVLDNGLRVLTQQGVLIAIGRARSAKGGEGASKDGMPAFLRARNLAPFITDATRDITRPIIFRPLHGGYTSTDGYRGIAYGCVADALPHVCQVYVDAADAGALIPTQKRVAEAARNLLEALKTIAMVALVDETTGYQAVRAHNELQRILEAYVLPEHLPWIKAVPVAFTKELYRLWGWDLKADSMQGPRYAGKLIRKYIYEKLPSPELPTLDRQNPTNDKHQRRFRHHQFLTDDVGREHFKSQLAGVMTLMRASHDKAEFIRLFDRAYGNDSQGELDLQFDDLEFADQ